MDDNTGQRRTRNARAVVEPEQLSGCSWIFSFVVFRFLDGRDGVDVESLMQQMGHGTRAMAEHYAKDAEAFGRRNDYRPFLPAIPEMVSIQ